MPAKHSRLRFAGILDYGLWSVKRADAGLPDGTAHLHDLVHAGQFVGRRMFLQHFQDSVHFLLRESDIFFPADFAGLTLCR